jgi:hypothetical protein
MASYRPSFIFSLGYTKLSELTSPGKIDLCAFWAPGNAGPGQEVTNCYSPNAPGVPATMFSVPPVKRGNIQQRILDTRRNPLVASPSGDK